MNSFIRAAVLALALPYLGWAKTAPQDAPPATTPLNEISGTVQSLDPSNRVLRLLTESGFNVEVAYTRDTVCKGMTTPKSVDELRYQDHITVRYAGRDLIAKEVEKVNPLQPAVAGSSPTSSPAN